MRTFLTFPLVTLLVVACGGSQPGPGTPGRSPCEQSCMSQEQACYASCTSTKAEMATGCEERCDNDQARCLSACR